MSNEEAQWKATFEKGIELAKHLHYYVTIWTKPFSQWCLLDVVLTLVGLSVVYLVGLMLVVAIKSIGE